MARGVTVIVPYEEYASKKAELELLQKSRDELRQHLRALVQRLNTVHWDSEAKRIVSVIEHILERKVDGQQ